MVKCSKCGNELEENAKFCSKCGMTIEIKFPHLRDWCEGHIWSPGCYHGSVGQGWEVVEKYTSTQNCANDEKSS